MFLQTHMSDAHKALIDALPDDDRKLVHDCCSSIIILGHNRSTIKKVDINRNLGRKNNATKQAILYKASCELNKTHGLRLYELEDSSRLLLVNSTVEFSNFIRHTDSSKVELTVLFYVLMDIFSSPDGKLSREDLEDTLRPLQLEQDDLKTHIDNLLKRLYIVQYKDSSFQQDKKLYIWGPRANAEIDPDKFFKLFMDMVGQGSEDDWPEQKKRIDKLKSIPNR